MSAGLYASQVLATLVITSSSTHAESSLSKAPVVFSLPPDTAKSLRDRNYGGRSGCPESNIFVHGFRWLDMRVDRTIWFLGAPDYLCATNSFITVILDASGEWTEGHVAANNDEEKLLEGIPVFFQHSENLGFFLTTEWQVEAPGNRMYYSANGEEWSSIELPEAESKHEDWDCCYAAQIRRLCIVKPDKILVAYDESEDFHASIWEAHVDPSFSTNPDWSQVSKVPDYNRCDGFWRRDFIPRSLIKKTEEGAKFSIAHDRLVVIPGPTM